MKYRDYKDDEEWHRWNQDAKRRIMKMELSEEKSLPSHIGGCKHSMERVENMSDLTGQTSKSARTKTNEKTATLTSPTNTMAHASTEEKAPENNYIENTQTNITTTESSGFVEVIQGVGVSKEMLSDNEIAAVVSESTSDNTSPSISMINQQTQMKKSRVRYCPTNVKKKMGNYD